MYSGSDTQFRDSSLEPKTEYTIRVCGIRAVPETNLAGPYSPPAIFTTLSTDGTGNLAPTKRPTSDGTNVVQQVNSNFPPFLYFIEILTFFSYFQRDTAWTDTQRAFVIVVGFTFFAVLVGVIVQQII